MYRVFVYIPLVALYKQTPPPPSLNHTHFIPHLRHLFGYNTRVPHSERACEPSWYYVNRRNVLVEINLNGKFELTMHANRLVRIHNGDVPSAHRHKLPQFTQKLWINSMQRDVRKPLHGKFTSFEYKPIRRQKQFKLNYCYIMDAINFII